MGSLSSYFIGKQCDKYENYSLGFIAYTSTVISLIMALIASFVQEPGFVVFLSVCLGVVNSCFGTIVITLIIRESGKRLEIFGVYIFAEGIASNVYNLLHIFLDRDGENLWVIVLLLLIFQIAFVIVFYIQRLV